jgi:hypothetical protein
MVAIEFGFQGPGYSIISTYALGIDAIGMTWILLKH